MEVVELPGDQQAAIAEVTAEVVLSSVKSASLHSSRYRLGDVFVHEVEHDIPQFLKIEKLLVGGSLLILLCQRLTTLHCSEHRCSCIVKECDDIVAVLPDHVANFYPLDLYRCADFCEVVPHYAILD